MQYGKVGVQECSSLAEIKVTKLPNTIFCTTKNHTHSHNHPSYKYRTEKIVREVVPFGNLPPKVHETIRAGDLDVRFDYYFSTRLAMLVEQCVYEKWSFKQLV